MELLPQLITKMFMENVFEPQSHKEHKVSLRMKKTLCNFFTSCLCGSKEVLLFLFTLNGSDNNRVENIIRRTTSA